MFQLVLWSFLLLCQFDPWLGLIVEIVLRPGLLKAWNIKGSHDWEHQSLNTTLRLSVLSLQSLAPFSHFPCSLSLGSNTWKYANKTLMSYYFHISIIRWGNDGYNFCLLIFFSTLSIVLFYQSVDVPTSPYPEPPFYLEYFPCSYLPWDKLQSPVLMTSLENDVSSFFSSKLVPCPSFRYYSIFDVIGHIWASTHQLWALWWSDWEYP